jgi:hypothetical protein
MGYLTQKVKVKEEDVIMDAEVASICNKVNRLCSSCWIPLRRM